MSTPDALPSDLYRIHELVAEAARELGMRREVYPRLVARGSLAPAEARRRIDLMEAIVRRLTRTAAL